jgi:hypothetical protein
MVRFPHAKGIMKVLCGLSESLRVQTRGLWMARIYGPFAAKRAKRKKAAIGAWSGEKWHFHSEPMEKPL